MPNLEIVRCTVTIETQPPLRQYGWVFCGVSTAYSLPFRSPDERERFVRSLAADIGTLVPDDDRETLAALLCLSQSGDEAAYACATDQLTREFAAVLAVTPLGELDNAIDLLLTEARTEQVREPEGER